MRDSCRNNIRRRLCRTALWALSLVLACGHARAEENKPFFFMHLTDPQFGFYADNAGFEKESADFTKAVDAANRLKPAFVIVTGDLVNKAGDEAQVREYLRIAGTLDKSIRLYNVPGNHDLGNKPTPASLAAYNAAFGPDHYSFREGGLVGIVVNTNIMRSPQDVQKDADEQEAWLRAELQKAKSQKAVHIVVFQHHPVFLKSIDEPADYHNLPLAGRKEYVHLLRDHGVGHVFAGHLHRNQIARDNDFEVVASGPVGKPLGKGSVPGVRIVIVRDAGLEHRYYDLESIPERIDPAAPLAPSAPATPAAAGGK